MCVVGGCFTIVAVLFNDDFRIVDTELEFT